MQNPRRNLAYYANARARKRPQTLQVRAGGRSKCDWRAGASLPSRFNGRFFSLYIYILYFGRWTPPYRNVLRDSKYAHKCEIS